MARANHEHCMLKITIVNEGGRYFVVRLGKANIASASIWTNDAGQWEVMRVAVHPRYRRRGVATALYSHIEALIGEQLHPSHALSDEGFLFWNAYRPAAVAGDLRHRKDSLMGAKVIAKGRLATIVRVGASVVTALYDDAVVRLNSETCIFAKDLDAALFAASEHKLAA